MIDVCAAVDLSQRIIIQFTASDVSKIAEIIIGFFFADRNSVLFRRLDQFFCILRIADLADRYRVQMREAVFLGRLAVEYRLLDSLKCEYCDSFGQRLFREEYAAEPIGLDTEALVIRYPNDRTHGIEIFNGNYPFHPDCTVSQNKNGLRFFF